MLGIPVVQHSRLQQGVGLLVGLEGKRRILSRAMSHSSIKRQVLIRQPEPLGRPVKLL